MAEILSVDWDQAGESRSQMERLRTALQKGGVIAFPTDTFYGLGADPRNPEALTRIFDIKQRPPDKPLLVLIGSLDELGPLVKNVSDQARQLMDRFWPGPLTLVFTAAPDLPEILTAGTGTLGVRLPAYPWTHRLLEELGQPLTAPSANLSDAAEPHTAGEVAATLGDTLDLIADGGPAPGGKPSTVVDTTTDPPTLIREGAVSRTTLETVLPVKVR